ncbi:hypothetical protein L3X38_032468 [Prunus dulcis]|uniref:Retrotransposon Copia-like N-terminal domain-containing protein n=1 Tax=Prunus dulcis TaxID=3755 RepID=A0AAD4VF89_PRUDU|nr:hypothetical protein L3X38_032468 [Prunus dulcis]
MFVVSTSCCAFSAAIMGDDSKIMVSASVFATNEERPLLDYFTSITSDKLDGSNYASWSRGAHITITSRRMASWINEKMPAPSSDSAAYAEWEEDNCLEIDCLRPHKYSCADDGARRLKELEADRVYDFLGGLDSPYDGVRSRILALSPVPTSLEAYAMVMKEDTRQSTMLGGGSMALKVDPARQQLVAQHDATGRPSSRKFSPSARSRPASSTPSSLDGPPKCHHCSGNHYYEKCFKEHGYPDWFADYKARMYGPKATCTMT